MYAGDNLFNTQFWHNGPAPGQFYNFGGTGNNEVPHDDTSPGLFPKQHAATPVTVGTSVIGIKFDKGVMIAADNLVSYGSLARFQDVQRVFKINEKTVMGAGGDFADFQSLKRTIDQKIVDELCYQDEIDMKPKSLYNWLTRILYARRSRFNPLFVDMVIGGVDNGEPFLGHVDLRGRAYQDDVIATGFGKHLALPLVRGQMKDGTKFNQEEASNLLRKCMEVLFYRDCRAMSKYSVAVCTSDGCIVQGPFEVNQNWEFAKAIKGY